MSRFFSRFQWPLILLALVAIGIMLARLEISRHLFEGNASSEPIITLREEIPEAILEPTFESVLSADRYLSDEGEGAVLTIGSQTRFYPFQVLGQHEVVNDTVGGVPVVIVMSPACGSATVFERQSTEVFRVADSVIDGDTLFMEEGSGVSFRALTGMPVGDTETEGLPPRQASVETWGWFKTQIPDGRVLSKPAETDHDYTRNPYGGYALTRDFPYPVGHLDARLRAKEWVYGMVNPEGPAALREKTEGSTRTFWICWVSAYPNTEVGGRRVDPSAALRISE